jgi:gliding motility-associated-like protein
VNPVPVVTAGSDVTICANSSIQLNASGAVSYVWTPATGLDDDSIANPVASPTVTTSYVVTGMNADGCTATDTVLVTISTSLSVFAGADVTICAGDTAQLSTSGSGTYSWLPATDLTAPTAANTGAFPSSTTTYTVTVTDANNCQGSDSVTVFVNGPVTLSTSGATTICIGQSATISATASNGSGPYTYSWSNSLGNAPSHTVSPTVTTTYVVSATDSTGCSSATQTITVIVNPPLALAAVANVAVCAGTPVTLSTAATGGDGTYQYSWIPLAQSGSSVTFAPAATTTVSVIVTDGCGSPADTVTALVTVNPAPAPVVTSDIGIGCIPSFCVQFFSQSTGNCVTGLWDFGDGNTDNTQNPEHCYNTTGVYDVSYTCTDANGCSGTTTVSSMITVGTGPTAAYTANVGSIFVVTPGVPEQVCFTDNSTNGAQWNWLFGSDISLQQSPCFTVTDTGLYCGFLSVVDANGCADDVAFCYEAVSEPIYTIPNVFTPNADGVNDMFMITGVNIKGFTCEIYDRWGVKIYKWNSATAGWDGRTMNGPQANDGVYYYVMQITDYSDQVTELKGFVQLIRSN